MSYLEKFLISITTGKTVYLLASGRLINLTSGNVHPVEIMDMNFVIQALYFAELLIKGCNYISGVYRVPDEIDM